MQAIDAAKETLDKDGGEDAGDIATLNKESVVMFKDAVQVFADATKGNSLDAANPNIVSMFFGR